MGARPSIPHKNSRGQSGKALSIWGCLAMRQPSSVAALGKRLERRDRIPVRLDVFEEEETAGRARAGIRLPGERKVVLTGTRQFQRR